MARKSRKQDQRTDVVACARDWASKPVAEQRQFTRVILRQYMMLRSIPEPDKGTLDILDTIKRIIDEYQKIKTPYADGTFVDRYLAMMEQTLLHAGPSYNVKTVDDLARLVPPVVECN
jgi:hypothetical protein